MSKKTKICFCVIALLLCTLSMYMMSKMQFAEKHQYVEKTRQFLHTAFSAARLSKNITPSRHDGADGRNKNTALREIEKKGCVFALDRAKSRPGEMIVSFQLGSYEIEEIEIDGLKYSKIKMDGCTKTGRGGEPELPKFRFDMALGENEPEFELVGCQWKELECAPPVPATDALAANSPVKIGIDYNIYNGSARYPRQVLDVLSRYCLRGMKGCGVAFSPFVYDFAKQRLFVAESGSIRAAYTDSVVDDDLDEQTDFRHIQQTLFLNASSEQTQGTSPGNLLIVCPDEWQTAMPDFCAWKKRLGFKVTVAQYPTDTGEEAENLFQYIQNMYEIEHISHVIICGDVSDVPPYYICNDVETPGLNEPTSDVEYSQLDGDDFVPDVFLSRIPAHDSEQLAGILRKFMEYEGNPPASDGWRERGVFVASSEKAGAGLYSGMTDKAIMHEISSLLYENGMCQERCAELFAPTVSRKKITDVLNDGASLFFYLGHGTSTSFVTGNWSSDDASSLSNGMMLPFVVAPVCDAGNMAYPDGDCLAEALFINGVNSRNGAVAVMSSTGNTLWNPPIRSMCEIADIACRAGSLDRLESYGAYVLDSVLTGALLAEIEGSTLVEYPGVFFIRQMHLFGDCSMMPRIRRLATPDVTINWHKDAIAVNIGTAEYGKLAGARISVFDDEGNLLATAMSDENGDALLNTTSVSSNMALYVDDGLIFPYSRTIVYSEADADGDGEISADELLAFIAAHRDDSEYDLAVEHAIALWSGAKNGSIHEEQEDDVARQWAFHDMEALISIDAAKLPESVDILGEIDDMLHVYANADELTLIIENGGSIAWYREMDLQPAGEVYPEYEEILDALHAMVVKHPLNSRIEYVGQSVYGRDIEVLHIYDSTSCSRLKLLVMASAHGDERTGTAMALKLATSALNDWSDLLHDVDLYILPVINPDGYEIGYHYNMAYANIERDFPNVSLNCQLDGDCFALSLNMQGCQPETQAIMRWIFSEKIDATVAIHGENNVVSCNDSALWLCKSMASSIGCSLVNGFPVGSSSKWINDRLKLPAISIGIGDSDSGPGECASKDELEQTWLKYRDVLKSMLINMQSGIMVEAGTLEQPCWMCADGGRKVQGNACGPLSPGKHSIVIGAVGYGMKNITVDVERGKMTPVNVTLEAEETGMVPLIACNPERYVPILDNHMQIAALNNAEVGAFIVSVHMPESWNFIDELGKYRACRIEKDGTISYLFMDVLDELLDLNVVPDGQAAADGMISVCALWHGGRHAYTRNWLCSEPRSRVISLSKGWNMVFPDIFSGLPEKTCAFDGLYYNKCSKSVPGVPVWMYAEHDDNICLDGWKNGSGEPELHSGWNLVCAPQFAAKAQMRLGSKAYVQTKEYRRNSPFWIFCR